MFRIPWDEVIPPGTFPADVIDDEIRNVKIAIGERMGPIVDWADDDEDPKKFNGWFVTLGGFQEVPIGEELEVVWDITERPIGSEYIGTPGDTVTIPGLPDRTGLYLVGIELSWDIGAGFAGTMELRKNGTILATNITPGEDRITRVFTILPFVEGDNLKVIASHNELATVEVGGTERLSNKFWGLKLGG